MSDSENPYRAPGTDAVVAPVDVRHDQIDVAAMIAWPTVFAMNMFLPVLLGLQVTKQHGQSGVWIASLIVLTAGWGLCVLKSSIARKLIFGSLVIALTQLFPILQILAGSLSLAVAQSFNLTQGGNADVDPGDLDADGGIPEINSELGGFVVTILVAAILLACASIAGVIAAWVLPIRWFKPTQNVKPQAPVDG